MYVCLFPSSLHILLIHIELIVYKQIISLLQYIKTANILLVPYTSKI